MPGVLKEEQYNLPIADGFAKYPAEAFEFVVGSAEQADLEARTVRVVSAGGVERTLSYDHLVLATGTRYVDDATPWKANGTNEETLEYATLAHLDDGRRSAALQQWSSTSSPGEDSSTRRDRIITVALEHGWTLPSGQ